MIIALFISSMGYIFSCTHGDQIIESSGPRITRGSEVLLPGNMTAGNANEWKLDKAHSSVLWSTNYVGASGLLTGRFNQFGIVNLTPEKSVAYNTSGQPVKDLDWAFYENDPSKTFFNGYVQINTSNTGEPGRDAGCNITAMGTVPIIGVQNLTETNTARMKTTKVELDPASNGYIVTLDLIWKGNTAAPVTKSVVGKLNYIPRKRVQFGTAAAYEVFGLQLKFQFNCRDFGITSTSISDKIDSLPADKKGNITLVAKMEDNDLFGNVSAEKNVPWGVYLSPVSHFGERTLYATGNRAPYWLLFMALTVIALVWGVIFYLAFLIIRLKKLGKSKPTASNKPQTVRPPQLVKEY